MRVTRITSWEELTALECGWNSLSGGMPFRSWDWLATWWKHYGLPAQNSRGANRELCVLAAYDDVPGARRLRGIAPWYLEHTPFKGNVLRALGDGEVCTDHVTLVCQPDDRPAFAHAVAQWLTSECDQWDSIRLTAVDDDDPAVGDLVAELQHRECVVSSRAADSYWALDLPADWEAYLAAVSKSHRKQLRRFERRVLESNRVRWHQVHHIDEFEHAWRILVDLHQRRRRSLGEPGSFASRPFHDFHHEAARRLLNRGQLRLSWLELDGTPAAAEYHLAGDRATYAYQGGVDPDRLDEEPGRLSAILSLQAAIREGHCRFDFLRGDEPYKAHWRAAAHPMCDFRIVPNRRLARLRGRVLQLGHQVTSWVKQTSPLPLD